MKVFGLTGGIGMGKSTSASLLAKAGLAVIDTDQIAREIVEPGQAALHEVLGMFGSDLLDESGRLNRHALAERVFFDRIKLKQLEAVLHPRIRERWTAQIEFWRKEGKAAAVVVIPLLFETDAQSHFEVTVCVACSSRTQRERLRSRGWSDAQITQRLAAQWPIEKKIGASNHVIWTEGDLDVHERQLERIFSGYLDSRR